MAPSLARIDAHAITDPATPVGQVGMTSAFCLNMERRDQTAFITAR
jgi:hypothetical protein